MDHIQHDYRIANTSGAFEGALAGSATRRTRLTQDWVCLRFPKLPEVSAGGIALEAKQYYGNADGSVPRDAVVVAVGPGRWVEAKGNRSRKAHWHPTTVQVGDRVLVDAMHTQEGLLSEWDGERGDFRLVRERVVSAVLDADTHLEVA